ncbi:K02A2.6-like, partial [Cordylochernes scorpioides]
MAQIQTPETFDFSTPNEWPKWRKRFERYLVVSGMKKKEEADKIDLFMYLMGDRADDIFRTFKFEKEEEATRIDSVLKAFDSHFCVRKNIIYERAKFNSRIQEDREPVDEFITSLYKLADSCEFEGLHEQLIRDRIVVGVRDKALSERMQLDSELTLEKAVKMVRQQEAVRQQQVDLQRPSTSQKVNQVKFNSKKQSPKQQQQPSRKKEKSAKTRSRCSKCGGFTHREGQACRAEGQRCNLCSKTGHFANCCPDKQAKTAEVKAVSELDEEIGFLLEVSAVEDSSNLDDDERECRRRWTAEIQVNGKKVKFKLDSQADVTCVPLCLFKKIMGQQRLVKSDINLRAAEFSELQTVGMFISTLRNGNYEIKEKIYVIRRLSEPLLSRRACELLNLARRIEVVATRINPIKEFPEVFEGLGQIGNPYEIILKPGAKPYAVHTPRRVPIPLMEKLKTRLEELEKAGIIAQVNVATKWCAPTVIAGKPNGDIRLCVDLSRLNEHVQREVHPMPVVEHMLGQLGEARFFSKLDANSGFHQIPLSPDCQHLTTFITPFGRYKYCRMPFGISLAPEYFQRVMSIILQGMDGVMCYLDDILIFASDSKTHDRILRLVLRKLKEAKVTLNKAKCVFGVPRINFLGHILDEDGIRPDPAKIEAVARMPAPTDVHGVRRFLGMVNHLGRFVENLSEIVAPLNQLLVKGQDFVWDCSQERAFRKLKELLTTQPILAAYDVRKPTMVSSDASSYGLGAVLKQEGKNGIWRPVAYSSRTMTPTEKRYAQIEKEALAITWACERFQDFLLGKRFRIETDHKPLIPLFSTKELSSLTPRLQRFRMRMMRFGFEIVHIPGKELLDADALSRQPLLTTEGGEDERPTSAHINAVLSSITDKDEMLTKIFEAQQEDTTLKAVVNYLEQGWPDKKKMSQALLSYWHVKDELGVQNGLLMRSCRLVIPASMKLEILDKLHAGHFGITKTRLRARETVWWPGISEEIAETVRKCSVCIQEAVSKHEPLIPTNFPSRPWQKIGMDLFKFENKWYLVVIDYYSRFPEMIQLDRLTASVVVRSCKSIFARHGIPETVVSDNGTQFGAAREFANFARQYGFTHVTSSPRFPQSNGMAEAGVKIAKLILKKNQDPSLGLLEYRSTPLENGYSPAELLMGRKLRTTLPIAPENLNPKLVDSQTLKRKEGKRRKDMKSRYDRRCGATDMEELSEGDTVWITDMRTWGIVKKKASTPRSYMVDTPVGTLRRNRFHLRKGYAVQYPADPSTPTFSEEELVVNEKTPVVDYPSNDSEDGQIRTRSGRIVKPVVGALENSLPNKQIVEALTAGVTYDLKKMIYTRNPQTPEEWLDYVNTIQKRPVTRGQPTPQRGLDRWQPESTPPPSQDLKLIRLLKEFAEIFPTDPFKVPTLHIQPVQIKPNTDRVIRLRPYRIPFTYRKEIDIQINEMLKNNIIEPAIGEYASLITLVKKKNGTFRMCVDFRKLNEHIPVDPQPIPLIESVIEKLSKAKYFSSLDLSNAYWTVPIHPDSRPYLAFTTHAGVYMFKRLPFGLRSSPQIFERAIGQILRKYNFQFLEHYYDDFIIFSDSFEEHLEHLRLFFQLCRAENIRLNLNKCQLCKTSISFLGYEITQGTYKPHLTNTQVIGTIQPPTNVKTLQSFLGVVNVYHKFIPHYAQLRSPLNILLKKNIPFKWTLECQKAFEDLKSSLTASPVLHIFKEDLPCFLYCDASTLGISGILKQKDENGEEHPVQYFSRSLRKYEQNYSISELECLAIIESIEYFRVYLLGRHFTIYSDHQALVYLKNIKNPSGRLFRWSLRLSPYTFDIHYLKGKKQLEADLLSRQPFCGFLEAQQLEGHQHRVPEKYQSLINTDGLAIITKKGVPRVVVPDTLRNKLLQKAHEWYNHPGITQLTRLITSQYYWDGMTKDINNYVRKCKICQIVKPPKGPTYGEMGTLPLAKEPYELMSMDTVAGFTKYGGNRAYLHVICDHMSRYCWTFPSKSTSTLTYIQTLKKVFQEGIPKNLLTDRAPAFTSAQFRRFLISQGIKPLYTTANHPQSNGLSERLNATITGKLKILHLEHPKQTWTKQIERVTRIYNLTPHTVTGFPPIYLLKGIVPNNLNNHVQTFPELSEARRIALQKTQARHKAEKLMYDQKHKKIDFVPGDLVLVKVYRHPNTPKLEPNYTGPYEILEILSPQVVRINRPNRSLQLETEIINIEKLRRYVENIPHITPPTDLPDSPPRQNYFLFPYRHFTTDILGDPGSSRPRKWFQPFNHLDNSIFTDEKFYKPDFPITSKPTFSSIVKPTISSTLVLDPKINPFDNMVENDAKNLDKVIKAFDNHFIGKRNVVYERALFGLSSQRPEETIEEFLTVWHRISEHCEYANLREELIRNRLVLGVKDRKLSEKLMLNENLTLAKAVEIARQWEAVMREQQDLNPSTSQVDTTRKVAKQKPKASGHGKDNGRSTSRQTGSAKETDEGKKIPTCFTCGTTKHHYRYRDKCPAKDKVCGKCGKKGHYTNLCRRKNNEVNAISTEETPAREKASFLYAVHEPSLGSRKSSNVQLTPTDGQLMAAANQRLENAGTFVAKLRANTREMKETLYVVHHLEQPLLGVGACEDLQLVKRIDLFINGTTDVNPEREFPKLFEGLGLLEQPYHIKLKEGAKPFSIPVPRRVPIPLMPKLKEQLDSMVAQEVIEPVDEPTEWCAPIVLAGKPNGKIRICVDLFRLNLSVERELHPLPVLEHELAQLNGAKIFSRVDANSGFWQIKLSEESQTLTTFITPFGRYKFKRLPFGISSAPEHFQKRMSAILRGVNGAICHMDDILIFAKRKEDNDETLREVLRRLKNSGITLNKEKCQFGVSNVTFLRHYIDEHGIKADEKKVKAIAEMKPPTDVHGVQPFMGMVNFLGRFVPNLTEITKPLNDLRKKDKTMISADASSYGLGAVLKQEHDANEWRPVAFASRMLTKTEQGYAQIEKEALAITWACERFKDFVVGKTFLIETDHKPLVPIFTTKDLNDLTPRLQRYRMKMLQFSFRIFHTPGKDLITADALSRQPLPGHLPEDEELQEEVEDFSLMKKNKDPVLALMEYRATPLANGLSPAELLFGRKIRTMLPCTSTSITPKTMDQSKLRGEEEQRKMAQKKAFDRRHAATKKAELIAEEKVRVKDLRAWGSVLEKASAPRSYIVETPIGTYRRNSLLLASSQQQVDPSETSPDSELPAETEETPGNELPAEELQQLPSIAPEIKQLSPSPGNVS